LPEAPYFYYTLPSWKNAFPNEAGWFLSLRFGAFLNGRTRREAFFHFFSFCQDGNQPFGLSIQAIHAANQ
jgi:hypothetical protein